MPISDVTVRKIKPATKPKKMSDGGGLHLLVQPTGSKLWRLAYRFASRQKTLALGSYPAVSLADARNARDEAKKLLAMASERASGQLLVDQSRRGHSVTDDDRRLAHEISLLGT
jgi:hypothetical protein